MMKTYARIVEGAVVEIIDPQIADHDIFDIPVRADGKPGNPILAVPQGAEIPIERRFHPELLASLVPVPAGVEVQQRFVFDGTTFRAPEPIEQPAAAPASVTMRQARLALLAAGKLQAVSDAIARLPSPDREAAQIEWEFAATVDRDSAFVQQLAGALGLDDAALDALFERGAAL